MAILNLLMLTYPVAMLQVNAADFSTSSCVNDIADENSLLQISSDLQVGNLDRLSEMKDKLLQQDAKIQQQIGTFKEQHARLLELLGQDPVTKTQELDEGKKQQKQNVEAQDEDAKIQENDEVAKSCGEEIKAYKNCKGPFEDIANAISAKANALGDEAKKSVDAASNKITDAASQASSQADAKVKEMGDQVTNTLNGAEAKMKEAAGKAESTAHDHFAKATSGSIASISGAFGKMLKLLQTSSALHVSDLHLNAVARKEMTERLLDQNAEIQDLNALIQEQRVMIQGLLDEDPGTDIQELDEGKKLQGQDARIQKGDAAANSCGAEMEAYKKCRAATLNKS